MTRFRFARATILCLLTLAAATPCFAQTSSPRDDLLRLVPKDFGFCLVINDLRGNSERWEKSAWIKALVASPLGQAVVEAPEFKQLLKFKQDLKTFVGFDWPTLRDDVLGDAVVLAYQPGTPDNGRREQGILLVYARRPEVLAKLIEHVNREQQKSGDLKGVQSREYKGLKYVARDEAKHETFYVLSDHFFAYTSKEELLKRLLEQRASNHADAPPIVAHLKKAGADLGVANLWINPRSFDSGIKQKIAEAPGTEGQLWQSVERQWQALDALVFSCTVSAGIEAKFTTLAREKDLPASARPFFMEPAEPSELWTRFPDNAILRLAARLDGSAAATAFVDLAPVETRQTIYKSLQPLAALVGMDLENDIAPNIGPDWGVCVVSSTVSSNVPMAIAALAVRPGNKNLAIDHALYRGIEFLAGMALFDYNRRHPDEPIRLQTLRQDKTEIKYLSNGKLFPAGFQPAWALKDGYLLLTTSPEAVAQFRNAPAQSAKLAAPLRAAVIGAAPFLQVSGKQLAKALRDHRSVVVSHVAAQNGITEAAAARGFDDVLAVIDIFDKVEITRSSGAGQTSVSLRIMPAK